MIKILGVLLLSSMFASGSAWASDCAKATSTLDKRICSDHQLKAADDEMSAAYFTLLGSIKDPQIHASLIESQRRWVKARDHDLSDLSGLVGDEPLSPTQKRTVLLDATRARSDYLSDRSGSKADFVATALKQRRLAQSYTGGPYAGYSDTSCLFIPDQSDHSHWTYNCFGTRSYQNGNRVCSEDNDFASYRIETTRDVSVIENGKWKPIAEFSFQNDKWTRSTDSASTLPSTDVVVPVIDPEAMFDEDDDKGWMRACLTDSSFPFDHKFDDK